MKNFTEKVIHINQNQVDVSMNALAELCDGLNELSREFKKTIGFAPDLAAINLLLLSESKQLYHFINGLNPNHFPKELNLDTIKSPETLKRYLKECFVRQKSDNDDYKLNGVPLDVNKLIEMAAFPSFEALIQALRNAIYKLFVVRGILRDQVAADLSDLYTGSEFTPDLLKGKIIDRLTVKTQSEEDNDLTDKLQPICDFLNSLQADYTLRTSESRGDGIFRGIDYFIDRENGKYVVSKRLLQRENIKLKSNG